MLGNLSDQAEFQLLKPARDRLVTVLILVFLVSYVVLIYPLLPQQYGFGKPTSVVLVLDNGAIPAEVGIADASSKTADHTSVTVQVKLLYKTDREYLISCDICKSHLLSVPAGVVKAVVWK